MRHVRALSVLPAIALLLAGCGGDKGATAQPRGGNSRTVDVTMTDNAFQPTTLRVADGETVTFRFRNTGAARHEGVIGDTATQERHHEEMTASTTSGGHGDSTMGGMGHGGDEKADDAVTVEPGQTAELTHTFDRSGTILIGCHEPGHWEAGMKVTLTIA